MQQGTVDIYTDIREVEMFKLAEERDNKRGKKVQSSIVNNYLIVGM